MYGYRARIGYTAPPRIIEVFPLEFYRMAPAGVTLMVSTMTYIQGIEAEAGPTFELALSVARDMATMGASIVVLGGAGPLESSVDLGGVQEFLDHTARECGVAVTSALTAQISALNAVGARRVAVVLPGNTPVKRLEHFGFEVVGAKSGHRGLAELGRVPLDEPAQLGRALLAEHPEADTLFYPAAHWPAVAGIDTLEQEFDIPVVTSAQAIMWDALRRCNIRDSISGFGRLLRDH